MREEWYVKVWFEKGEINVGVPCAFPMENISMTPEEALEVSFKIKAMALDLINTQKVTDKDS